MTNHLRFSFMALAAAAVVAYSAPARANQSDELTYLTFSAPVELPGVALPAGTYIFKHVDDDAGGRVVQVLEVQLHLQDRRAGPEVGAAQDPDLLHVHGRHSIRTEKPLAA